MKKLRKIIFLLLFLASLFLYFFRYPKMLAFDADQEFYAKQYLSIFRENKLTLLGIETSVGGMFVGPAYTYLSSLIYWIFKGDPMGMFLVTLIFASFQASLTYDLFTKLRNEKVGIIAGVLVVLSASPWNKGFAPSVINLLYPTGLFFFYVVVRLKEHKKYFFWLGVLLALTFQIHFSLFLFFPIAFLFIILRFGPNVMPNLFRHPKRILKQVQDDKIFIISLLPILISLLPLVIFDLRHQFFISSNLGKFIDGRLLGQAGSDVSIILSINWLIAGLFNLFTHILVPKPGFFVSLFVGGILIFFTKKWRDDFIYRLIGLMYIISILFFLLYRNPVPDYYWYFLLPAFFFVASEFVLFTLNHKLLKYPIYIFLLVLALKNLHFISTTLNHYNYHLKKQVAKYIKDQSGGKKVKISYDTDLGLGFGFDYLLKYEGVNIDNENFEENYHIVIRQYGNYKGVEFHEPGSPVSIKVTRPNFKDVGGSS